MFTVTKSLELQGPLAVYLNYVISLAVLEAVQDIFQGNEAPLQLKWPNDLYSSGLKVGGVLIHSTFGAGKLCMQAGVGLNVLNRQPTTCLQDLMEHSGIPGSICREVVLAGILNHMETMLQTLQQEGFEPLESKYIHSWLHSEQEVDIEEKGEDGSQSIVSVTIKGLSPNGFLLAVDSDGRRFELQPDGNSFDMMKGLIRRKL
ncbi:unnamed protein product [Ostreobium quekettii]|uniref:BPL/LPL catalytic domain-containing protein n=1 Tax=Ostreobium quekettii TaxID=121088 RepID=A0A8S1IWE7_9CHLO|nr:unnamed protein product [Ostreobium quekettii]|eukprot:evm.model.scf_1778.2 EVM.evm.TU.scf_1778.2   scf_1778:1390-3308(-)